MVLGVFVRTRMVVFPPVLTAIRARVPFWFDESDIADGSAIERIRWNAARSRIDKATGVTNGEALRIDGKAAVGMHGHHSPQ
jgi:hypothetical protein